MKIRGVILGALAMMVLFASYACAIKPDPVEPSSAAPVMVPYLNKSISEVKENEAYRVSHRTESNDIDEYQPAAASGEAEPGEDHESSEGDQGQLIPEAAGDYVPEYGTDAGTGDRDERSDDPGTVSELVGDESDGVCEEVGGEDQNGASGAPVLTYYGNCRITFYDVGPCCCGEYASGITASGEPAVVGWTVANGSLPFGTMVMIDGQEYCVTDRGVNGDEFDVLVGSHEEALQRGLYYADVYIIN